MAKILDFERDYDGITDGEAWQLNYEQGDNYVYTGGIKQLSGYRGLAGLSAKVIRGGLLKKIDSTKLVVGDTIVIEAGDTVPADGIVTEDMGLQVITLGNIPLPGNGFENQRVYQGMKIISGSATVLVTDIGEKTYLGQITKQMTLWGEDKNTFWLDMKKNIKRVCIVGVILFILSWAVFAILNMDLPMSEKIINAFYPSITLFMAYLPVEAAIAFGIILGQILLRAKKMRVELVNPLSLGDFDKLAVLCIDSKFFKKKNIREVQRIYKAGIRILMIADEGSKEALELAKSIGLCGEDAETITADELKAMPDDKLRETVLNTVVFSNMDSSGKLLIVQSLKRMGVNVLAIGNELIDAITIRIADIGLSTSPKKASLECEVAEVIFQNDNFEFIVEILRLGRKFRDAMRKSLSFTVAMRIFAVLTVLLGAFLRQPIAWLTVMIPLVYIIVSPIIMFTVGLLNGDEDLIDRRNFKNSYINKGRKGAILQGIVMTVITAGVYIGLQYIGMAHFSSWVVAGIFIIGGFILAALNNKRMVTRTPGYNPPQRSKAQRNEDERKRMI